jgi:type I restriction enzyme, S subunit
MAHSTDMAPYLSLRDQLRLHVTLPEPEHQRWVARFLAALDDKIELNRRMNETLESLARAIFKSWFVDFNPVRAKAEGRKPFGMDDATAALFPDRFSPNSLPEGWSEQPLLSGFVDLIGGGTPKTSVPKYWDGNIPWFSVVDSPSPSDMLVVDTEKKITALALEHSATCLLDKGTTIITARGTVGKIALVGVPMAMNQSCYEIRGLSLSVRCHKMW